MDKLDWKIVAALERDGRQSYADLGEQVGLSKSPCWSRVKNLEESGVIAVQIHSGPPSEAWYRDITIEEL